MALKLVTMAELCLEALLKAEQTGLTVTEIYRRYEISRQTYWRYRHRYLAEGLPGFQDRSRGPLHPANQISAGLEVEIVGMRKDHPPSPVECEADPCRAVEGRAVVALQLLHQSLRAGGAPSRTPESLPVPRPSPQLRNHAHRRRRPPRAIVERLDHSTIQVTIAPTVTCSQAWKSPSPPPSPTCTERRNPRPQLKWER